MRRSRRALLPSWLTTLVLLTTVAGGCSTSSAERCRSTCEDTCRAFASCNLENADAPTCVDDCMAGSDPSTCASARPADQLTCDELKKVHDCAQYCVTLCRRGPSCGTFSESFCNKGCADYGPPVCNSASVEARTCDQLKPELRTYEDRGRALAGPGASGGGSGASPMAFGLCRDGRDCTAPLGCSTATNTCAPCTVNAECARDFDKYVCSSSAGCMKVDCITAADCSGVFPACDTTSFKCVGCLRNEDCASALLPSWKQCDVVTETCVECLTDADCTPSMPVCELSVHLCLPGALRTQ